MGKPAKEPSLLILEALLRGLTVTVPYLGRNFALRLDKGELVYGVVVKRKSSEGKLLQQYVTNSRLRIVVDDFVAACNSMSEKDLWKIAGELAVDTIERDREQVIE